MSDCIECDLIESCVILIGEGFIDCPACGQDWYIRVDGSAVRTTVLEVDPVQHVAVIPKIGDRNG